MPSEPLISDAAAAVDPLQDFSGVSLFPRTIRASTNAPPPVHLKDLESLHHYMKSMDLRSPQKGLEEAKTIVDSGSELLNAKFPSFVASMGVSDIVAAKDKQMQHQERRPGLGRKRPRFSLKPDLSQSSTVVEPNLDIDQLQDPEKFFCAFEKLEMAKMEMQRQRGESISASNVSDLSSNVRPRRPGILGKSASYKHRYSSLLSENDSSLVPSQEQPEHGYTSGLDHELQENDGPELESGSGRKLEEKQSEIFDELLSNDIENLEGNGALSLLQERLQVKSFELDALRLPEFVNAVKVDDMSLGERIRKPRKTRTDIHDYINSLSGKMRAKYTPGEKGPSSTALPTPPKSPFASLSLLRMQISQSNPQRDPFLPLNIDLSLSRDPSSIDALRTQYDQAIASADSSNPYPVELNSGAKEECTKVTAVRMESQRAKMMASEHLPGQTSDKNSSIQASITTKLLESLDKEGNHYNHSNMDEEMLDDNLSRQNMDNVTLSNNERNENGEGSFRKCISPVMPARADAATEVQNDSTDQVDENDEVSSEKYVTHVKTARADTAMQVQTDDPNQMEHQVEDMTQNAPSSPQPEFNLGESATVGNLNTGGNTCVESEIAACEDHGLGQDTVVAEINPKLKKQVRKQCKKKGVPGEKELKALSRRKSLADCGTSFQNGIRRSKRIRTRPLQYWKGERLLYDRVNDSLKLIGMQYISPAKGELKVKAYSDEFVPLIQKAALH